LCVHDNGGEFLGHEFQQLLAQAGITSVPTTVKNPQANAICERFHTTMADVLRVILRTGTPDNELEAEQIVDNALATCMHVTRCSINHQMRTSPGALVFNRDMFLDVPLLANLEAI
jgi:transposase InsO family protein